MPIQKFKNNKLYKLNQNWCEYYDDLTDGKGNPCTGYHYAKVAPDIRGLDPYIVDCWIVNKEGKVHPGFNASPVPINKVSVEKIQCF